MSEVDGREWLHDLKHAVGYPRFYRNHYCAEIGGPAWKRWQGMVAAGLAKQGAAINDARDMYFSVTEAGLAFLRALPLDQKTEREGG